MAGMISFIKNWRNAQQTWTTNHRPAANTKATATQAAPGAGWRNVCTGITATICANSGVPTPVAVGVRILSDATEIWGVTLALPGTAGATTGLVKDDCWIPAAEDKALTIEFTAAGGASTLESVSIEGTTERV